MLVQEGVLYDLLIKTTGNMVALEKLFNILKSSADILHKESNKVIDQLNELRKNLQKVNEEWQDIKGFMSSLKNYEGKVRNFMCSNSQNKEQRKCEINLESVKK